MGLTPEEAAYCDRCVEILDYHPDHIFTQNEYLDQMEDGCTPEEAVKNLIDADLALEIRNAQRRYGYC